VVSFYQAILPPKTAASSCHPALFMIYAVGWHCHRQMRIEIAGMPKIVTQNGSNPKLAGYEAHKTAICAK